MQRELGSIQLHQALPILTLPQNILTKIIVEPHPESPSINFQQIQP